MSKINKILIIFIMLTGASIFGLWKALQSPYFAGIIASYVNEKIISKVEAEVEIGNIEFSLFPPATHLNKISIQKENLINVYQDKVSLSFSIWDFLRSELRISKIEMDNGYIEVLNLQPENNSPQKKKERFNLFTFVKEDVLEKLPVQIGEMSLNQVDLVLEDQIVPLNKLEIKPYKYSIDLEVSLDQVDYESYSIDGGDFKFEILKDKVRIIESRVFKNSTLVDISGTMSNLVNSDLKIDYKGRVEEFIPDSIQKEINVSGNCNCEFTLKGNVTKSPLAKVKAKLTDIVSDYGDLDSADIKGQFQNNLITISHLVAQKRNGSAVLNNKVKINTDKFEISNLNVSVNNLHTHDILKFLGPDFEILNGRANGVVSIDLIKEAIIIKAQDEVLLKDFHLGYDTKLLAISEVKLSNLAFDIRDSVRLKGGANFGLSSLKFDGFIDDTGLDIKASSEDFLLPELGGDIGQILGGRSKIDAHFVGPFEKVLLNLNAPKISNLEVLSYQIPGDSYADVTLNLTDLNLKLNKVQSLGQNKLEINGDVDFDKSNLKLNFDIGKVFFAAFPTSLKPIWKEISPFVSEFDGQVGGALSIVGDFDNLRVQSSLSSNKISYYEEPFTSFNLAFYIDNDGVFIDRVVARKDKATIKLSLDYLFKQGLRNGKFSVSNLKLNDLNLYRKLALGYDGTLSVKSSLTDGGERAYLDMSILKSSVGRKQLKPSRLNLKLDNDRVLLQSVLLGGKANINGIVNIGKRKNELSTINSSINVKDLKTILGIVSLHNIYDTDLSGEFLGRFSAGFKVGNLKEIDFDLYANRFRLQKLNKFLTLTDTGRIYIRKSKIDNMNIKVRGTGGYYSLIGSGNLNKDIKLEQNFNIDLAFLQLISPIIKQSQGRAYGRGVLSGNLDSLNNYHELNTENVSLKINKLPISFDNGEIRSVINNDNWTFSKAVMNVGGGKVNAKGNLKFNFPFPELSFDILVDSLKYPIADKSVANVGGKFTFSGSKLPYILSGNAFLNSVNLFDEFGAFTSETTHIKGVDKYLSRAKTGLPEIIELALNVSTIDSIRVKNRLVDILLNGNVKVSGDPEATVLRGRLNAVPTLSRFKFKGNDFLISNGSILLDGPISDTPFTLNFTSESKVNQYDVKMDIVGGIEDIQINMESNPSLSQEDIFSLLTLGVTSDFTKNLEEKDKASLTTIGIGTLLVDQLKINEGLDSTLGLKLSVLPEVSESDESPIQASQGDQSNRVKTATKLRIQKKVTKNVDLTFSNTFGGDDGSKQEMNIDFNINDRLSIQGVFEKESDSDDDGEDSSVGADIKYKWSF